MEDLNDSEFLEYAKAYMEGENPTCDDNKFSHYKKAFLSFKKDNAKVSWNWCSFIFGGWHLLYRKAYVGGAIALAITYFLSGTYVAPVICWILAGMFGDYIIYKGFNDKLTEAMSQYQTKEDRLAFLKRCGGINKWVVTLGIVITIISLILIALFIGGLAYLSNS